MNETTSIYRNHVSSSKIYHLGKYIFGGLLKGWCPQIINLRRFPLKTIQLNWGYPPSWKTPRQIWIWTQIQGQTYMYCKSIDAHSQHLSPKLSLFCCSGTRLSFGASNKIHFGSQGIKAESQASRHCPLLQGSQSGAAWDAVGFSMDGNGTYLDLSTAQ